MRKNGSSARLHHAERCSSSMLQAAVSQPRDRRTTRRYAIACYTWTIRFLCHNEIRLAALRYTHDTAIADTRTRTRHNAHTAQRSITALYKYCIDSFVCEACASGARSTKEAWSSPCMRRVPQRYTASRRPSFAPILRADMLGSARIHHHARSRFTRPLCNPVCIAAPHARGLHCRSLPRMPPLLGHRAFCARAHAYDPPPCCARG